MYIYQSKTPESKLLPEPNKFYTPQTNSTRPVDPPRTIINNDLASVNTLKGKDSSPILQTGCCLRAAAGVRTHAARCGRVMDGRRYIRLHERERPRFISRILIKFIHMVSFTAKTSSFSSSA